MSNEYGTMNQVVDIRSFVPGQSKTRFLKIGNQPMRNFITPSIKHLSMFHLGILLALGMMSPSLATAQNSDEHLAKQLMELQAKMNRIESALNQNMQPSPGNAPPSSGQSAMQGMQGMQNSLSDQDQASTVSPRTPIKVAFQNCTQCHQTRPTGPLPASHLEFISGSGSGAGSMTDTANTQGGSDSGMAMNDQGGGMGMGMMGKGMGMMGGGMGGMGSDSGSASGGMGGMSGMAGSDASGGMDATAMQQQLEQMKQQMQMMMQMQMMQMKVLEMQMKMMEMGR